MKTPVARICLVSKRFLLVGLFFNYAIADDLYNLFFPDKTGPKIKRGQDLDFYLCFNFFWHFVKSKIMKL